VKRIEKVQKELEKLTTLKNELPQGTMEFSKARELISNTEKGKEVIQSLKRMKITSDWLREHGFIIAFMLLDL